MVHEGLGNAANTDGSSSLRARFLDRSRWQDKKLLLRLRPVAS
jgi:hypothetical protein